MSQISCRFLLSFLFPLSGVGAKYGLSVSKTKCFKSIFSKLSGYGFDGWAVLEWECCIKSAEQGEAEGAPFIASHIIDVTTKAFDDLADSGMDKETNKKLLGL